MKIIGADAMTVEQIQAEVQRGAKFVVFQYCISIIFMTFRRGSDIYFIRPGESALGKGMPFTLLSLVAGWWGLPWGPIFTIGSLFTNLRGGKDVTHDLIASLRPAVTPGGDATYNGPTNWWAN